LNVTKNIYVGLHCSILHAKVIDWKRRTSIEGHQFLRLKYINGVVWLLRDYAKSHTVYGLVSTSVTLNDLESRNSPYFVLFHRIHSMALQAYYVTLTVVAYCLQNIVVRFWPKLTTLRSGVSAIAELLVAVIANRY